MPAIVIAGGPPRRRRSQSGGLAAFLAMIAVVAATAAAYVAWPRADAGSARKDGSTRKVASRSGDAQPPEATMAESPQMAPRERQDLPAAEAERREPDRDEPSAASPAETAPAERQSPEPAEPVAAAQPATVEVSIREAFAALRRKDHAAARQAIADARKAVGDNDFGGRVSRWHLLVTYAEQLAVHLEQAIASANEGREYQIGNLIISVIEITPTTYAFKEGGQIRRGPRERMPKAIERAILEQWFIADGRAANHILLGVHLLLDDPSRLPDVRTEWDIAMAGEPATAAILPLLEDPLLAGSAD